MTTPISDEVAARKVGGKRRPRNFLASVGAFFVAAALTLSGASSSATTWPSARYREEPAAFADEILGQHLWSKQLEIVEAVRDHKRVAVASGHKIGKSNSAAVIALWFYASFEEARVVMSSTTSRQVDQILWREVRMLHARSGRCVACKKDDVARAERREPPGPRPCPHATLLDGQPMALARTGLRSPDFREIVGFTAREAEAVAGISGKNLLYILDEASGIPDEIFEAIEGNRAGGARVLMISNPTRTEGEFFKAFHEKKDFYRPITISSEETPNVIEGRDVIPGLATREWIDEKKREWGEDSPLFKVRIKGQFVPLEEGKVLSIHAIGEAEKRWDVTPATGRLQIGLDPAGEGLTGDESVFACRRGLKINRLVAHRGQSAEALLIHCLGLIREEREPHELPVVVLDSEGLVGARVYGTFRAYADAHEDAFELVAVRSSHKARREPDRFQLIRDELWGSLEQWVRDGGAIPEDTKLAQELHAPWWSENVRKQVRIPPKKDVKKILGRSPDRADAVCLAVWEVKSLREDDPDDVADTKARGRGVEAEDEIISPHGGAITPWGGSGGGGEEDL